MADIVNKGTRSRMMSAIRGKDTKPELSVRRFLHGAGLRYVLHDKRLPGKPDLVFPSRKAAVFVHGCFWHHHRGCKNAVMPKSNEAFWKEKIEGNIRRDRANIRALESAGWRVFVVWECAIDDAILKRLTSEIKSL